MEEEAVNKKAEEGKKKKHTSLKSILGGDILATDFFRRQTKLLVLIMVFVIFYILFCSISITATRASNNRSRSTG